MLNEIIKGYHAQGWRLEEIHGNTARMTRPGRVKTLAIVRGKVVERNFTMRTGLDMPVEIDF
jgi:hypothetical protein